MALLLFYLLLALLVSFLCSLLEAILLSITPTFIASKQQEGKAYAKELQRLKVDVDRPLSAILTLNTFAHTIGAAGVGAQAQRLWGEESLSVVSAGITLIILVFSEIIPKTLGATYWKTMAYPATLILKGLVFMLYPFVWLSQRITKMLRGKDDANKVTRADFSAMAEMSSREGVLHEREFNLIKNVLRFSHIKVKDVMTPRNVMTAFPEDIRLKDMQQQYRLTADDFSRLPVYSGNVDHITGYVLKDEVLMKLAEDQHDMVLKELKREALFIREEVPVSVLFKRFIDRKEHMAIALEEYGGTAGVVTMEDVMETMLGMEIMDEMDDVQDMQQYAREMAQQSDSREKGKRSRKL